MGVDIVGWRACPLQERLGEERFLEKLKLRAYERAMEAQVDEGKRATCKLRVVIGEGERTFTYEGLREELGGFERGIAECAVCPLSGGTPVGCYRYITYPIDRAFEEVIFKFFCEELLIRGSSSRQLFDEAVQYENGRRTPFHDRDRLIEGDAALDVTFDIEDGNELTLDSAELVTCVLGLAEELPSPQVLFDFLKEFLRWVDERAAAGAVDARVTDDGVVEFAVSMAGEVSAEELSFRLALSNALRGKTLAEVRVWKDMLEVIVEREEDGWYQVVHG